MVARSTPNAEVLGSSPRWSMISFVQADAHVDCLLEVTELACCMHGLRPTF